MSIRSGGILIIKGGRFRDGWEDVGQSPHERDERVQDTRLGWGMKMGVAKEITAEAEWFPQ
jgi:hypothetical protein